MWSLVNLSPTGYLFVDQGTAYTSKEVNYFLEAFGVRLDEVPIEAPGAIGVV